MRPTTALHLLRAGVDSNTLRAWLGHVSLETTNRYAQGDLAMQAKALETCAPSYDAHSLDHTAAWHQDRDLMVFLASLYLRSGATMWRDVAAKGRRPCPLGLSRHIVGFAT